MKQRITQPQNFVWLVIGIYHSHSVTAAQTRPVRTLGDLPLTVISHGQLDANAVPPA